MIFGSRGARSTRAMMEKAKSTADENPEGSKEKYDLREL